MNTPTSNKIDAINKTILRSMAEGNIDYIVKNFTDDSIKIFGADFGFIRGKFMNNSKTSMIYQSSNMPCEPVLPVRKRGGNALFDSQVKKSNYEGEICRHLKSYLIVPIRYVDHVYGNLVLGYKKYHDFEKEELLLSDTIGNALAQIITINWHAEKSQKDLALNAKQREIEVLLEQEKLRTEFIGNATHELRTPLAIMKGNAELAQMEGSPKSAKEALGVVIEEINILSNILNDLTLLTSITKDPKGLMPKTRVNISDLIGESISRLSNLAENKKISIRIKGGASLFVLGNKNHLEKLFLNIIKNAIAYGKESGYIDIDLLKEKNTIKVKIKDNGMGISREDLPKIFERFYRADKAHSGSGNHSGLGLAIAKWVAEIHGGEIKVESAEGKGSTFTVLLPLA